MDGMRLWKGVGCVRRKSAGGEGTKCDGVPGQDSRA